MTRLNPLVQSHLPSKKNLLIPNYRRAGTIFESVHTRRQVADVAATRRGDRSLHVYRSGYWLQQYGEATRRSDKSLRVYWIIFCENRCLRNRILSLQQVAKNQVRLNLYDFLQRQRFSQKSSSTHQAICRCNVSPRHVAATCRPVCTDLKGLDQCKYIAHVKRS